MVLTSSWYSPGPVYFLIQTKLLKNPFDRGQLYPVYFWAIAFTLHCCCYLLCSRCFCPLQPAVALAPINCTQTAVPPTTEGSSTKSEAQTPEADPRLAPPPEPQEVLQEEKDVKSNWKDTCLAFASFILFYFFYIFTSNWSFVLGAKGRAEGFVLGSGWVDLIKKGGHWSRHLHWQTPS